MRRTRQLMAIALTSFSLAAYADDGGFSQTYNSCMDASGGITMNMLDCSSSEIERQDARLNQNYKAAMRSLEKTQQTQLRDAQRLWIKFRDADCGLLGILSGGTMDRINASSCFLDMTKKRADHLQWLADFGG